MEATTDAIIRIVQSCVTCYASVNIEVLEILRYSEHTCNYLVISDNWLDGKIAKIKVGHSQMLCGQGGIK